MFEEFQSFITPALTIFGDNRYIQALLVIAISFVAAWLFNRVIITSLKKFARKTDFDLDDHLIGLLHSPIHISILLLGVASATIILSPPELFLNIIFSLIKSLLLPHLYDYTWLRISGYEPMDRWHAITNPTLG